MLSSSSKRQPSFYPSKLITLTVYRRHAASASNFFAEENRELRSLFVNELLQCKALERHNFSKIDE